MMNGMLQTTVGTCVHVQVWTCTGIDQGPQLPRHRGSSARQGGDGGREGEREGGREEWTEKGGIKRGREERGTCAQAGRQEREGGRE